ncbi:MAG: DUF1146 domain-containing protein [Bacilli bacterium]|nr:DUF1146 domain-containing protein [Bacilli bacterium]
MDSKFLLYIVIIPLVIWSIDSININQIFKKNKVVQAQFFYFILTISLSYLVTNFIYDVFLSTKFI